jgi:lipopolysaccharide assembly outer membrane protein LptD (OstA)
VLHRSNTAPGSEGARLLLFAGLALLFFAAGLVAPEETIGQAAADSEDKIFFDAGRSKLKEINGERVLEGLDGVKIIHGDVVITGNRAIHYQLRRLTYLIGNVNIDQNQLNMKSDLGEYRGNENVAILKRQVRILDRGLRITCDRAVYYRTTETAWLTGNVVVVDSSSTLTADSLFYDKRQMISEAFGDVVIVDEEEGIRLRGNHGFYYQDSGEGVMDVLPRLVVDPESPEPTTVDSDTMRFFPDEKRALAYGRVKILKGGTITQCDSAVVTDNDKQVVLYGNPLAKQGNTSMQGERMNLRYNEDEVDQIKIVGEAMIREVPTDTLIINRDSWVKGDSMTLFIHNNRLDSIVVSGSAVSEYYPRSPGRVESNYVEGDSMFFFFEKDSLDYVKIVGGRKGLFQYINLSANETSDTLRALLDTSLTYIPFPEKAEPVAYSGDTIQYYAKRRDLVLDRRAKVEYSGKTLLGDHVTFYANLSLLDAEGSPVLIEGPDKLYGRQMDYDLDSGVGLVQEGSTKFMDGYYSGSHLSKVGDDVLKVWNSKYTTCDRKVPHYYFTSNNMKVYLDDKVVTGPIVLRIGETPLMALPFYSQNIRRGRRSGILRPSFEFGFNSNRDRFIRNIGYYWATNDLTDFTFVGDFNEYKSIRGLIENRYKLRYAFTGGLKFSFLRTSEESKVDNKKRVFHSNQWTLDSKHNQTLGEKASFTSDLRFVSSDVALKAVSQLDDVQDVIDRRIESRMSLRKSWSAVGFSASARRTQILDPRPPENGSAIRVSGQLPNISLSIPSRSLYFGSKKASGRETVTQKVLESIRYSPGLSMNRATEQRIFRETTAVDTVTRTRQFTVDEETITGNASLSFSAPLRLMFLSLSPRLAATDNYTRTTVTQREHNLVVTQDSDAVSVTLIPESRDVQSDNAFNWNTGVGANTNFFGTFYPKIGSLRGIRHTITPSVTYSYQPSISGRPSSQRFGVNLKNAIDLKVLSGSQRKITPGEEAAPENQRRGVGGIGDMPVQGGEDIEQGQEVDEGEEEEEKLRKLSGVLIWTLSSSYNPDAASKRGWSTISSLVNLRVIGTNFSISNSIDPYTLDVESTRLSSGLSLGGTHPFGSAAEAAAPELNVVARDSSDTGVSDDTYPGKSSDDDEKGLPWSVSMAFSYSKSGFGEPSSTMNLNGNMSLTQNWKISYRTTYDVVGRDFLGEYISITRDLHCWEMSLARQKLGDEWEFYFRINLKSHPELYAEQGNRGLGGGTFGSPFN